MFERIKRIWLADDGASAVEYGLLVALIAVVIIGAVTALGRNTQNKLNQASNAIGS